MKTQDQIEDILFSINENIPSKYPGMTYEQGITEALAWVLGETDDNLFDEYKEE